MKKIFVLLIIGMILTNTVKSQKQVVINRGGDDIRIAVNDIQRISFNENNMLVKLTNSGEESFPLENLLIKFLDTPINVEEITKENIDVNIFVTIDGEITVESPHGINSLTIFDINGRELQTRRDEAYRFSATINANFLNAGIGNN